jgi:hypothetical protein
MIFDTNRRGFLYNGSMFTTLDDPATPLGGGSNGGTVALGVSGGTTVGFYTGPQGSPLGFVYDGTNWKTIMDPVESQNSFQGTTVTGISGNLIVGYYGDASSDSHGFTPRQGLRSLHVSNWSAIIAVGKMTVTFH